jgi:hypothetical protein
LAEKHPSYLHEKLAACDGQDQAYRALDANNLRILYAYCKKWRCVGMFTKDEWVEICECAGIQLGECIDEAFLNETLWKQ